MTGWTLALAIWTTLDTAAMTFVLWWWRREGLKNREVLQEVAKTVGVPTTSIEYEGMRRAVRADAMRYEAKQAIDRARERGFLGTTELFAAIPEGQERTPENLVYPYRSGVAVAAEETGYDPDAETSNGPMTMLRALGGEEAWQAYRDLYARALAGEPAFRCDRWGPGEGEHFLVHVVPDKETGGVVVHGIDLDFAQRKCAEIMDVFPPQHFGGAT